MRSIAGVVERLVVHYEILLCLLVGQFVYCFMAVSIESAKRVGVWPSYNGTGISCREKGCLSASPERKDEGERCIEREREESRLKLTTPNYSVV
jgi:hypothetical protein